MKRGGDFISFSKDNKKGQVTVFIIVAILIVGLAIAVYFLGGRLGTTVEFDEKNPNAFIQTCIGDEIENAVNTISLQGGSLNPENFVLYQDNKVEYLCYTSEYYAKCSVQQPFLKEHIESEIENAIKTQVSSCFDELRRNYEERAYAAGLVSGNTKVELLPKRVIARFDYVLTLTKTNTERHDSFSVVLNNNLYELSSIANSIVDFESEFGDAETTLYMTYYKDLKVEKLNQVDGSTIYILTDRNTENKFRFASRSVAWPPGYGVEGVATN